MQKLIRIAVLPVFVLLVALTGAARAGEEAERLGRVLLLPEVAAMLRSEGLQYGADLDRDFLGGTGSAHFAAQVDRVYDEAAMLAVMQAQLAARMDAEAIAASLAFFDTDMGRKILGLELTARAAITDEAVEDAARQAVLAAQREGDTRAGQVSDFIEINDLTDRNLTGAMGSNFQFLRGLAEGGGQKMTEADILEQVYSQEEEIRTDTRAWLDAFLFMAYGPLTDAEMEAYLEFSRTRAGQALNAALFAGFDEMYGPIYYGLGLSVAQAMQSSEL